MASGMAGSRFLSSSNGILSPSLSSKYYWLDSNRLLSCGGPKQFQAPSSSFVCSLVHPQPVMESFSLRNTKRV